MGAGQYSQNIDAQIEHRALHGWRHSFIAEKGKAVGRFGMLFVCMMHHDQQLRRQRPDRP